MTLQDAHRSLLHASVDCQTQRRSRSTASSCPLCIVRESTRLLSHSVTQGSTPTLSVADPASLLGLPPSTVELHTSWHSFVLSSSQLHCRSIICSRYPAQGRLRVSSHCIGFCWWTSLGLSEPMTNPFPSYRAASNWRLAIWSKLQPWQSVVAG